MCLRTTEELGSRVDEGGERSCLKFEPRARQLSVVLKIIIITPHTHTAQRVAGFLEERFLQTAVQKSQLLNALEINASEAHITALSERGFSLCLSVKCERD